MTRRPPLPILGETPRFQGLRSASRSAFARRFVLGLGLALVLLLGSVLAPTSRASDELPARLEGLDAFVENGMRAWGVPGLALAIVKDDRVVVARGYGTRKLGEDAPVDETTIFAVASNTKALTAGLLGTLVDEGKLGWDDRVVDWLPSFQMWDPYVTRDIRVRDLLIHRSGLHTYGGDHLWIGNDLSREDILSRIRHFEPRAPFRTKYQYQNLMYLVAGQVAAAAAGKSWDDALRERLLDPLGMKESSTTLGSLDGRDNVATPHELVDGTLAPVAFDNVDSVGPAASLNSNAIELAQWMRLQLGRGELDGNRLLSEGVIREMQTVQMPLGVSDWSKDNLGQTFAGYGLGWGLWNYRGHKAVSHGGALSGMISRQVFVPDEGLGIVILTNLAPNNLPRAISFWVLDAFLGEPERDWSAVYLERKREGEERGAKAERELHASRIQGTSPSLPLESFAGTYANPMSGPAEVRVEDGQLVFDYNPRHAGRLEHWHHDTFRVTWNDPIFDMPEKAFVRFELDESGAVASLETSFYQSIRFDRIQTRNP